MASTEDDVVVRLKLKDVAGFVADVKSGKLAIDDLEKKVAKAGRTAARESSERGGGFGALSGVMRGMAHWGGRGALALGAAGVATAAFAVKSAASVEQVTVAFTTLLHSTSAAKSMMVDLQHFAATTPFNLQDVEKGTQKLLAFGFTAKSVIPSLTAVGDAAAGLNLGPEGFDRVITALGQIKMKGRVQGDEMLQLAEAGINARDYLQRSLHLTPKAYDAAQRNGDISANTAIPIILSGMEKQFKGLMDKQSHTLGGIWSNFHDAIQQGLVSMTSPFLPVMEKWLQVVVDKIPTFTKRFTTFGPQLWKNLKSGNSFGVAASVSTITGNFGAFGAIEKAVDIGKNLVKIFRESVLPTLALVAAAFAPLLPIVTHLDDITGFLADHSTALRVVLQALVVTYASYKILLFGINTYTSIQIGLTQTLAFVKGEEAAATNGQKVAYVLLRGAVLGYRAAALVIKALNMAAWWVIQKGSLLAYRGGLLAVRGMMLLFRATWFLIRAINMAAWWAIQKTALLAYRGAIVAVRVATWAWAAAQTAVDVAMDANPIGAVVLGIAALVGAIVWVVTHLDTLKHAFSATWDGIKAGFKDAVNYMISGWNSLIRMLPQISIPGIGTLTTITPLATGGTAVQPGTALVGEAGPELVSLPRGASVIPLPRVPEFAGGSREIHTHVYVDKREIAHAVHSYVDDKVARR